MKWAFHLTDDERHLAKLNDLDSLEQGILRNRLGDEIEIGWDYERIFEALSVRSKSGPETLLNWGQRYLAWATRFTERDGFPIQGTEWATRFFEIAVSENRPDLARSVADAILCSYAPLEKERRWWQKQFYALTAKD